MAVLNPFFANVHTAPINNWELDQTSRMMNMDYPAAHNNPVFAFKEPLFCHQFPNISASLPGDLSWPSQGHWLLILWGLRVTMHGWVW